MFTTIGGFILCAALIFFSGSKLSRYGDIIADHLGWGKGWVGLVLMASVTSLPELIVGISSTTLVGSADLALGDVMGSCAFNLGILSLLDAFVPKQALFSKASGNHILAASMGILLVALVGVGLYLPGDIIITRWIGFMSILFIIVYFLSVRILYSFEMKVQAASVHMRADTPNTSLNRAMSMYAINAVVVIGAALFLPHLAEELAKQTGLGESFVGTLFLAASTSFPEIAVCAAAVRMGLLDMAVGSLLGSNIFNILILAIDDMFYTKGYLLKDAADDNIVSAFAVIIMTTIAIAGLTYRQEQKRFLLAWDSLLIFMVYIANVVILYWLKG